MNKQIFADGNDWWKSLPEPLKTELEGVIIYDGYYDAILGYTTVKDHRVLVYSTTGIIDDLAHDFMSEAEHITDEIVEETHESAREFYDFNIAGGWLGPMTPLLMLDDYMSEGELHCNASAEAMPGFIGMASRCADKVYAIFDVGQAPRGTVKFMGDVEGEVDTRTPLEMTRITHAT